MGPCPICGTGWGGLHRTLSVFLYGGEWCCVCRNEWYFSRTNGFQLNYMEGTFTFPFCLRMHSLFIVESGKEVVRISGNLLIANC